MRVEVKTLTEGSLWRLLVKPGDRVIVGAPLFIMEVMKMEVPHEAPCSGEVKAVHAEEGAQELPAECTIVEIESP